MMSDLTGLAAREAEVTEEVKAARRAGYAYDGRRMIWHRDGIEIFDECLTLELLRKVEDCRRYPTQGAWARAYMEIDGWESTGLPLVEEVCSE